MFRTCLPAGRYKEYREILFPILRNYGIRKPELGSNPVEKVPPETPKYILIK
jgi:hypothetical protein